MTYTGNVAPGGDADVRETPALRIAKLAVDEEMANNVYLLTCRSTGQQALIDAADDAPRILRLLADAPGDGLASVITTHQHWDHHRALAEVVRETSARAYAGEPDADAITEQTDVRIDVELAHGDTVAVGDVELDVIHLRGHTPGSIALLWQDPDGHPHLWTGDSLFPGGVGNTFGDDDAFRQLLSDVEERIFDRLPDDTWFYPGHGDDGRLGDERPKLAEWRERGW